MKKLIISAAVMFAFAACDGNRTNTDADQQRTDSFINETPDTSAPGSTDTTNNGLNDSGQIRQ